LRVRCALLDTTTERPPLGLAAMNRVKSRVLPVCPRPVPHFVS